MKSIDNNINIMLEKWDLVLSTDPDAKTINIRPLNNIFFSFDFLNQAKKYFSFEFYAKYG